MINIYRIINKKRLGEKLSTPEIFDFVEAYVNNTIDDSQAAALLMAICINGMDSDETAALTNAMTQSGEMYSLGLDGFAVDKHSTGGIGDKVTLIAAPICAACGLYVPKMSGRGLGYTGGTIDKLESIPGMRTALDKREFIDIINKCGFSVASQTDSLVPADKKLYALRSTTATVESIPLICSSIMSKKLAVGADGIVLDVKVGDGAFMKTEADAEALAQAMLKTAEFAGKKCTAIITDMNSPLGHAVGNSIEVTEAIEALKGNSADDLREDYENVCVEMLLLSGYGPEDKCLEAVRKAVGSGNALEKLRRMIELQGGDPHVCDDYSLFGKSAYRTGVYAERSGYISAISCEMTGMYSLVLGAGRRRKGDTIDPTAGISFAVSVGDHVEKGDLIAEFFTSYELDAKNDPLSELLDDHSVLYDLCDEPVIKKKNIIKTIRNT